MKSQDQKDILSLIQSEAQNKRDEGFYIRSVLSAGQKRGLHRNDLWKLILEYFNTAENQKAWSDWENLNDREEIRLRLKILQQVGELDASLTGFIQFFFRASDPILYQLSAKVMGREMGRFHELREYFQNYCVKRNVSVIEPIKLNNQRIRRRILLVLSASFLDKENNKTAPLPLAFQDSSGLSDPDLSILLISCGLLLQAGRHDCVDYAVQILENRFKSAAPIKDRNLIRNAGILIDQLKSADVDAKPLFGHCAESVLDQQGRANSFADRLQALLLIDELVESSVVLQHPISVPGPEKLNTFINSRSLYWSFYHKKSAIKTPRQEEFQNLTFFERIHQAAPYENYQDHYHLFAESVTVLSSEQKWRTLPVDERAYYAFFQIDFSIHTEVSDEEELYLLLKSSGFIEGETDSKKIPKTPLSPIIRKLITLEPSLNRQLFDPQLIHRLDDPDLLPVLLPTSTDSEFLPMLADAVEHQVRFRLATEQSFNPEHYLYLLTVRRPHYKFYRHLAELSQGREYLSIEKVSFPLYDVALSLAEKASDNEQELLKRVDSTNFGAVLSGLREDLRKLKDESDPQKLLRGVVSQLRGTGAEEVREGITLQDLIEIVQPHNSRWCRAGDPPYTSKSGHEITERILSISDKLSDKINKTEQAVLNSNFRISETVQGIERYINILRDEFVPLLGSTEAKAFDQVLLESSSKMRSWDAAYGSAVQIWENRAHTDQQDVKSALLNMVSAIENEAIQLKILSIVMDTLLLDCDTEADSGWLKKYELLEWAAENKTPEFGNEQSQLLWHQIRVSLWGQLVNEAMDRNAEARVVQLIKVETFSEIRNHLDSKSLLEKIKVWCFNRYDIFHAMRCNNLINDSLSSLRNGIKTCTQFGGHFARVWLALLVGVIFMFDFGDPWFELAEIGDVGGVIFAFSFGVAGTFLYVWSDLRKKTVYLKGDPFQLATIFSRVTIFLAITFVYTALVVCLFWYMFSSTDQVVHGEYAPLHLLSWTGFALFVGVFFGLIGRED